MPELDQLSANVAAAVSVEDPTAYLLAEHAWTRVVLDNLRADVVSGGAISGDVEELEKFIDLHIRREEEAYFPALEPIALELGLGSTSDMYGEHDAIRIRLEQLTNAIARSGDPTTHLAALRRALVVHFDNEEELLFFEPASRLTDATRREVIEKFQAI